jgi:integrase
MTLGRVETMGIEDARRRAKRELGAVADGEDPQSERRARRDASTVKDLCEWYLATYVVSAGKSKHSVATDRSYIRCHLSPDGSLASRRITEVTRHDVEQLKIKMARTPGAFRKVLAILNVMFRRAEEIGARPSGTNPCAGVKAARPRSIERFLTSEERVALARAFEEVLEIGPKRQGHISRGAVDALRFLAITGMRAGEVSDILCWGHVDWQHGQLRLPRSKTGAKVVHLSDAAVGFLRERYARQPDAERVFVGENGGRTSIGRSWREIRRRAGLTDVRMHDLRHAFASDAIMAGVPIALVGKLLGHRQMSTTQRYAHLSDDAVRQAANTTAGRIESATRGS